MGKDQGKLLTPIFDRGLSHPYRCRGSTQMRSKPAIRQTDDGLLFWACKIDVDFFQPVCYHSDKIMNAENQPNNIQVQSTFKDRVRVLEQIRNPLVFSALALLIIESAIGLVINSLDIEARFKFYTICIMAFLFLVVFIAVMIITFTRPTHLYENIAKELENAKHLTEFVNTPGFREFIEDVIINQIKPECLKRQEGEGNHGSQS